jgi:hypothetical protein
VLDMIAIACVLPPLFLLIGGGGRSGDGVDQEVERAVIGVMVL